MVEAVPVEDRAAEAVEAGAVVAGAVVDGRAVDRVIELGRTAERRQEPRLNAYARIAGITKSINGVFPVTG